MLVYICSTIFSIYSLYLIQSSIKAKSFKPIIISYKKIKYSILISYIGLKTISKYLYIIFLQYMNSSIRKIDKNMYELTYIINGNTYKMIFIPTRGPCTILQISDENMNDITDEILPYFLGMRYDYITPNIIGYKSLMFELSDGTTKEFIDRDKIEF